MALVSPGVEVSIIDQSQYLPAPTNSIPFVLVATAQDKADPNGVGVAQATTAANAGRLYEVTSQRDLVTLYGTPFFYQTSAGTPIQGYELNEYGLLAAYSLLGVTNRCYVLRADIDLASLVGQTGRPSSNPDDGAYWLDSTNTTWGINEWNAVTGKFTTQTPIVIVDSADLSSNLPLESIGNIGDYAVNALDLNALAPTQQGQYFYKTTNNTWVILGSDAWASDIPTIQGNNSNPTLTAGQQFSINLDGDVTFNIAIPAGPNDNVTGVAGAINALGYTYLSAGVRDGRLCLFLTYPENGTPRFLTLANVSGTPLAGLGITAGTYYRPVIQWGTSSQQPLWQSSQTYPRPTGSVWLKASGSGLNPVIAEWDSTLVSWVTKNVALATSDASVIATLDATGGKAIPAGSVYGQYGFNSSYAQSPVYLWERFATGPTVVTGTAENPIFGASFTAGNFVVGRTYTILSAGTTDFTLIGAADSNPGTVFVATGAGTGTGTARPVYALTVQVTEPGTSNLSSSYNVNFTGAGATTATAFVTAWLASGIPYTNVSVTTDGAIQITHTEGGSIILNDTITTGVGKGRSSGLLSLAGFVAGTTDGVKRYNGYSATFANTATSNTSGSGDDNLTITVDVSGFGTYTVNPTVFGAPGANYGVGDTATVLGTLLGGASPANDLVVRISQVGVGGVVQGIQYVSGTPATRFTVELSNWREFDYTTNEGAPVQAPVNNTNWFYSEVDQVDILVNYNGAWRGYGNQAYDSNGFPTPTGSNATDPNGPIVSASAPTTQSDNSALVYGDLWIDTSDLENYPVINRWQSVDGVDQWVLLDNTDQTNPTGVLFVDARWATNGTTNPFNDPIPTIKSLLTSDYLDLDAPSDSLYPTGMLLFNTRRSGYNVKQFRTNYFNATSFPDEALPTERDAWVTASGLQANGAPYMGRKAQRAMVVEAMRATIDTNVTVRDEDVAFNLLATPNYPELQPNMVVLNADRGETGYIIGDTPMGLADSATAISAWANNTAGATSTGEEGLVTRNTYLGLFYPSGIASDLSGNLVAVPASHMMLRTFLRNDAIAYPWFAAAGTRRGLIDNAANIGYVNRTTGEFQVVRTSLGIRDTLYTNFINPLVFFTGNGLLNYGNKTSFNSSSALDRTNVARLVAFLKRQLTLAARPFIFEPNDALTRGQISGVIETLLLEVQAKRGIYDYLVICDESNNTPARIDRNELWVDVAIEPVKAVEFIYIPVRILNTGEIASL
jgi:hypothetical protein